MASIPTKFQDLCEPGDPDLLNQAKKSAHFQDAVRVQESVTAGMEKRALIWIAGRLPAWVTPVVIRSAACPASSTHGRTPDGCLHDLRSSGRDAGPVRRMRHRIFDGDSNAPLPGAGETLADHGPPTRGGRRQMRDAVTERRRSASRPRDIETEDPHQGSARRSRRL